MPAITAPEQALTDGVIALRPAAERDIPEVLIAYQDDPELHLQLGEIRPPSGAELGRASERAAEELAAGREVKLTITEPGVDVCRGQVHVHRFEWTHLRAELGVWLAPQARGRGWAPRALRLTAGWLFSACGIERVQLLTAAANGEMLAAARTAGFQQEGVLRAYALERGRRVDHAILSLLPQDLVQQPAPTSGRAP